MRKINLDKWNKEIGTLGLMSYILCRLGDRNDLYAVMIAGVILVWLTVALSIAVYRKAKKTGDDKQKKSAAWTVACSVIFALTLTVIHLI